jgi:DNA polymerase III alpha subunit
VRDGDSDKVRDFLDDARRAKVTIHPPDIARSRWEFEPEDGGIRSGSARSRGPARGRSRRCARRARGSSSAGRRPACTSSRARSTRPRSDA